MLDFDPEKIRLRLTGPSEDERLHQEISKLQTRKLPLYAKYVMKHHSKVFKHAIARHGRAARIECSWHHAASSKKIHLLTRLRDTLEHRGVPLATEYYFGTVKNTKLELKTSKRALIPTKESSPRLYLGLAENSK
jgi:hypothetical protein